MHQDKAWNIDNMNHTHLHKQRKKCKEHGCPKNQISAALSYHEFKNLFQNVVK